MFSDVSREDWIEWAAKEKGELNLFKPSEVGVIIEAVSRNLEKQIEFRIGLLEKLRQLQERQRKQGIKD